MKPLAYLSFFSISLLFLFATVKSPIENDLPVGTVIYSVLPPTDFKNANGQKWVLLTGQKKKEFDTSELGKYWQKDLPDARGMFIRTMNDLQGDGADPDKTRIVGSIQMDLIKQHKHKNNALINASLSNDGGVGEAWTTKYSSTYEIETDAVGETRPKNIALYLYIKIN